MAKESDAELEINDSIRTYHFVFYCFSMKLWLYLSLFLSAPCSLPIVFLSIADHTLTHLVYPWLSFHWIHPQLLLCLFSSSSMCLWRFKQFLSNCFVAGYFFLLFSFVFYLFKRKLSLKLLSVFVLCFFRSFFRFIAIFLFAWNLMLLLLLLSWLLLLLLLLFWLLCHCTISIPHTYTYIRPKINKTTDVTFTVIYNAI